MFTAENFPEEIAGYKAVDQKQFEDNIIVLEYSHKNIYWIVNKLVAVKFPGLDNKRLFVHVLRNGESGYYSNGCFSVQNDRSILMSLFTYLSVGDIDYSNCGEFVGVEYVALSPEELESIVREEYFYDTNVFGDTLTIKKNENDLRFVEVEFDSEYCVVKGVSESGNVSDMFNTCRTGFIVEYIKEFLGDYSNVRIGMVDSRLDVRING